MRRRYIIVGSGCAGLSAAQAIREADDSGEIVIFSDDPHCYYSRPGLAYFLTGEIPESQLFPFRPGEFHDWNIVLRQERAARLAVEEHNVLLQSGEAMSYDRLLLATGSSAVLPALPGIELEGVVKLDDLQDARRLIALAKRARNAVVVGGGITALEIVEGLRPRCRHVHYLLRGDRYWSNVLDETESRIVEDRLEREGVVLHRNTRVAEIQGPDGRVASVRTTSGERIACELLAFAIGVRPRLKLAVDAGLKTDRGVLVDDYLSTSAQDIFAAGDVAQIYDPVSGKALLDTLWSVARAEGAVAGRNMAGGTASYDKRPASNVTRLAGLTTTVVGTVGRGEDADLVAGSRGESESWRKPSDLVSAGEKASMNRLRVLVGRSTLAGALVMGDQALSRPLQQLIAQEADISTIREALLSVRRTGGADHRRPLVDVEE